MKRFFLIDDDDVFNYLHRSVILMVSPDAEISTFKSGEELIQFIRAHHGNIETPDLIFLDIRMPDMNGFTLLDTLQVDYPFLFATSHIYMLSSTLDERDLNKAKSYSMVTDFISKPLTVELISTFLS